MGKRISRILKDRKGFTLLELVVVVAVVAIIGSVVGISIYGYMKSAYTLKANQTAKTVFYAAQNHLTEVKEKGRLKEFNKQADKYGQELSLEDEIKPMLKANGFTKEEIEKFEKQHSTSRFRYIYLDGTKASGTDPRMITDKTDKDYHVFYNQILEPYVKDSDITDHSFLLEYDTVSGVVMSVFYTEKIDGFIDGRGERAPYDVSEEERYNVMQRGSDALSDKWQGYYGVYKTNLASESIELMEPEVKLVNGERLILSWQDTNKLNQAFIRRPELKEKLYFEIQITSTNRKTGEKPLSIKIPKVKMGTGVPETWAAEEGKETTEGKPLYIYYTNEQGEGIYELLLDCMHHSILGGFSGVKASDMLQCTVTAKLEDITTTKGKATSNLQSAAFGGGDKTTKYAGKATEVGGSGNTKENGTRATEILSLEVGEDLSYSVHNTRHFNNMRYVTADKDFMQTGDVHWEKFEDMKNEKLFEPFIFMASDSGSKVDYAADAVFQGSYRVKDSSKITGIQIRSISEDKGANIGIFAINGGEISGINLESSSVTGITNVGSIAGTNNQAGSLSDVSVTAAVTGYIPDGGAQSAQKEKYASNIGGIVGVNQGVLKNLKTGSASVSGRKNTGGIIGSNETTKNAETLINANIVAIVNGAEEGWVNFGGITGYNKAGAALLNCENQTAVQISRPDSYKGSEQPSYIGGITGYNEGVINTCISQDKVTDKEVKAQECIDGLNKVNGALPSFDGTFVGGITGINAGESAKILQCSVDAYVTGNSLVGGITGANYKGEIQANGADHVDVDGLIIASGSMAGGVTAYTDGNLQNLQNNADVFADAMTGGVTGFHGALFESAAALAAYNWEQYFDGKEEKTTAYYHALLNGAQGIGKAEGRGINNCVNKGFVYARTRYSGGIAGINWARISNSYCDMDSEDGRYVYENAPLLRKADCAGGVAGLNRGSITSSVRVETDSIVYGRSFAGGVVGCNLSSITGYEQARGSVFGSGDYIGGFLGMNTNAQIVSSELTKAGAGMITGQDYVAGLIGGNLISEDSAGGSISIRAVTDAGTSIVGEAYVGGIIGYHSILGSGSSLPDMLSSLAARNPYEAYNSDVTMSSGQTGNVTTEMRCTNKGSVDGFRYVGGIIGLNEENSSLTVQSTKNYGNVSIAEGRMAERGITVAEDIVAQGDVTGTSYFIGGITGRNTEDGRLTACYNNGTVSSPSRYLGGLCEINEGIIENCTIGDEQSYHTGVEGKNSVGGIVGLNHTIKNGKTAEVTDCNANQYAYIKGGSNTGGLVGTNKALVKGCRSYANVTSTGDKVGGIVGVNVGTMQNNTVGSPSYAPYVSGQTKVGGFVGENLGAGEEISKLTNYANVEGIHLVGGIVGNHNAAKVTSCSNYGTIKANGTGENGCAGGITGINDKNKIIQTSYNYGTVVSHASKAGGIAGWNKGTLQECVNEGTIQGAYKGNGADAVGGITGTNQKSARVKNCASRANSKNSNYINGSVMVGGLVGQNLGLVSSSVGYEEVTIEIRVTQNNESGSNSYIGGIIGRDGTGDYTGGRGEQTQLERFEFGGSIYVWNGATNVQFIGGILGASEGGYIVDKCKFTGSITGKGNASNGASAGGVGGISGSNNGTIILNPVSDQRNRYATQSISYKKSVVEGNVNVGGIVGVMQGGTIRSDSNVETDENHIITNYTQVTGARNVGGIIGRAMIGGSSYSYMYNQGTISGSETVGGIIGSHSASDQTKPNRLSNMQNEEQGRILAVGKSTNLGGITGNGRYEISNCKNFGTLGDASEERSWKDVTRVGGIIGNAGSSRIESCENNGAIYMGNGAVGGIAGSADNSTFQVCINEKKGLVDAPSTQSGGIIGSMSNSNTVTACVNKGTVKLRDYVRSDKADMQIGGIVGYIFANDSTKMNTLTGCRNEGTVKVELSSTFLQEKVKLPAAGGIIGYFSSRSNISGCVNSGTVDAGNIQKAGGIMGRYHTMPVPNGAEQNKVQGNRNTGTVSGGNDTGGITGYNESFNGLLFAQNVNEGTVSGMNGTGGIIGNMYNYNADSAVGEITDCENNGIIEVRSVGDTSIISGIGGLIGKSSSLGVPIKNSINKGTIRLLPEVSSVEGIGGIIGTALGPILEGCKNEENLDFTSSHAVITCIGGIAGKIQPSGTYLPTLKYCENKSSIIGGNTDRTGGIVGEINNGTLLACKNLAPTGTEAIRGNKRVGGIAGVINDPNAKIMGEVKSGDTDYSFNEQTISGNDIVGGIAGEQNRAVFYTLYNTGKIYVSNNKNTAGGIIGLSKGAGSSENTGLIINCYNIGAVSISTSDPIPDGSIKAFAGGLVGFRESSQSYYDKNSKMNVNDKNICNSTVIKDSYYITEGVDKTLPALSMNGKVLTKQVLAVGNEPFNKFQTPNGDSQGSPLEVTGRFIWSEATFDNMLKIIEQQDKYDWNDTDPYENIKVMLDHYFYKLPVPKGLAVTGVEGHTYNMKWGSQVGLNAGLEISVYDRAYSQEELKSATPLFSFKVSDQTTEGVNITVPDNVTEQYMGKAMYIATKAYGYKLEGIDLTLDSDKEIVQSFVLMPPLPQPKIAIAQEMGTMKVTLTITNIAEYLTKPNEKYPILGSLEEHAMYSAYKNGLDRFVVRDYYRSTESEGEFEYKMKERVIEHAKIDWNTNTASITIDYALTENQMENRLYHTYRLQAAIPTAMGSISLEPSPPAPSLTYRYLSSTRSTDKYKVATESFLLAPEELMSVYTGTLMEPSFALSWKNPKDNQNRTGGYKVKVTNPDNKKSKEFVLKGEAAVNCALTYADLQELMDSFEYKSFNTLTFTVQALGDGTEFKDSIESAETGIQVPMKQKTQENFVLTTEEPIYSPNIVKVEWKDHAQEVLDTDYRITLLVNGAVPPADVIYTTQTTDTHCMIQLPNALLAVANADLSIQVTKTGNLGASLDSDIGTFNGAVMKRLPQITSVSVSEIKTTDDPSKISCDVGWTAATEITDASCQGYLLALLPTGELEMSKAETIWIEGAFNRNATLMFDISNMGSEVSLYIFAVGKENISSTSLYKEVDRITLPTERAPASTNLQVLLQDQWGQPIGAAADEETLKNVHCVLSWTNPDQLQISGHRLMLKNADGKIVPLRGAVGDERFVDLIGITTGHTVVVDLTAYQGKKMYWSVINKPTASGILTSEPVTIEFNVPTIPPVA